MAIVHITTTNGAVPPDERARLAEDLAKLTYEAEGFAGSAVAPAICWTFFDERPERAFATGAGDPAGPLYYLQVTALAGAIDKGAKQTLGEALTLALLAREGVEPVPEDRNRVWVRFMDVDDGDLIVGGQATSLDTLKAFVAAG